MKPSNSVFCIILIMLLHTNTMATNFQTKAGGSGIWSDANNWVGGITPGTNAGYTRSTAPNDTIFIDHPLTTNQNFQLIGPNLIVIVRNSFAITSAKNLEINNSKLIVHGGIVTVSSNFIEQSNGTVQLSNNGTINVSGNAELKGIVVIDNGSTLNITGSFTNQNQTSNNITLNGQLNIGAGMTNLGGTWNIGTSGNLSVIGNFIASTGAIFTINGHVTISGNTDFNQGNYTIASGASFKSNGNGMMDFGAANIVNDGVMDFPNGTSISKWAGIVDCDGNSGNGTVGFGAGAFCSAVCAVGSASKCVDNGIPLPIELLYFSVSEEKDTYHFNWETISESDNDFFTIEYSYDIEDFKVLAQLKGAGNSSTTLKYDTTTAAFSEKNMLYFRLKQTDYNGKSSYSNIVSLETSPIHLGVGIFPNPANNRVTIHVKNTTEQIWGALFNSLGNQVTDVFIIQDKEMELSLENSYPGLYSLKLYNLSGSISEIHKLTIKR